MFYKRAFYLRDHISAPFMRIKYKLMSHQPDNATAKVFFALWPASAERNQLVAWQTPLKKLCSGRAMRGETLHNTLVFIGDVEHPRLEALRLAAQEVSGEGFELCFEEARYWGHNHIVYAAPTHIPRQLAQLVGTLEQRLTMHRFQFDTHEYKPHVTLLRNTHWTDVPLPVMQPVRWQIKDFALVQSLPEEYPGKYQVMARFPLPPSGG